MKQTIDLIKKFGNPFLNRNQVEAAMIVWVIPQDIAENIPALPEKIFCNALMVNPLEIAFRALIRLGLHTEIKTYDGCFNIRLSRSGTVISKHAWGLAIDLNAADNPLNGKVTWSKPFLEVWREGKWTLGADWTKPKDGMHFQWDNF